MSTNGTADGTTQDDPVALAKAFASAGFHAELGGEPVEVQVGCRAPEVEARLPATSYAFITAWNPAAERRPVEANAADDDALATRLAALGFEIRRTWAQDAGGGHREAGWLVAGVEADRADALGREFGQAGILAWRAGEPVRLHMLMARPRDPSADLRHVDWIE